MDTKGWEAVADTIRTRRTALHLTQEQLAVAAGISAATLGKLESARQDGYQPSTLTAVEDALGLPRNHLRAVYRGTASPPPPPAAASRQEEIVAALALASGVSPHTLAGLDDSQLEALRLAALDGLVPLLRKWDRVAS